MSDHASEEKQSIQIGAIFPQTEIGVNPHDIARYATGIEAMGFRHVLVFDHVIGGSVDAYPHLRDRYTTESLIHEIFVLFGYFAAITRDLELAAGVLVLPQRQTALVAKQAAAIDVLSRGRLRLGVGIGWNDVEFQALNENFRNRARRMEEQIGLLQQLWSERVVDFEGEFHTVRQAGIYPLPVRKSIPIWIGASAEPAVRRAARLVDGFMATTPIGPELDAILGWLRDELSRSGRSFADFGLEGRISLASGTEDDWKREFTWWQEMGASHMGFHTRGGDFADVEEHLHTLERALRALEGLQ